MADVMAFDVDGTLFINRTVEERNVEAIKAWQAAGNLAVCNTGKSLYANRLTFEPFDIRFDYHVLYTGAVVTDANFQILFKQTLPAEVVEQIFEHTAAYDNLNLYATTLDQDYLLRQPLAGESSMLLNFEPLLPENFGEYEYVGVPLWIPDAATRDELFTWLSRTFEGQLTVHRNQDFLDVVPYGCDKGSGMRWLVEEHLAGTVDRTFSLGDSWNDLGMHRYADHSGSFSYSPSEVQAVTDEVVDKAYDFIEHALGTSPVL